MTRPVERMNTAMRTLQEGDLTVRIASDREDELGQMSRNFNIMANELEQNVQEKIEKQKELNASHIAMMQAQLNPHFLYNTLDTMKWVAKANHIPEIATMAAGSGQDPADQYLQEAVHLPEGRTGAGELLRGYPEDPFQR